MLKKLESIEEINDFYKDLENKAAGSIQKARIYGMACDYADILAEKEKVRDIMGENIRSRQIIDVHIISHDIAIVETKEKWDNKEKTIYHPIVNGKKASEASETFDFALVIALSQKYGEERCAPRMIYKMLSMDKTAESIN